MTRSIRLLPTLLLACSALLASSLNLHAGRDLDLAAEIAAIAAEAHGRVGVACALPGAALHCDFNAHAHFPMQSVYKLPLAMAVLDAVERGKFALNTRVTFLPSDLISPGQRSPLRDKYPQAHVDVDVKELLELTVSQSDGVAADILTRVLGGSIAIDRYIRSLRIDGIRVQDTEKTLGQDFRAQYRNYAKPAAMVLLLRRLADHSPLTPEHTALLFGWMTQTPVGERRLKGMLPAGTRVAHKPGTSGQHAGITAATNDVGLITLPDGGTLAVAVFVSDSPEPEAVREGVIAKIADAIWQAAAGN